MLEMRRVRLHFRIVYIKRAKRELNAIGKKPDLKEVCPHQLTTSKTSCILHSTCVVRKGQHYT